MPCGSVASGLKVLPRVVRVMEHANGDWFLGCDLVDQIEYEELEKLLRG